MAAKVEPLNLKVLSIDGGGIRGLSSLLMLQQIMYRVGNQMDPRQPGIQPWQYFDLIGGTSTGGIIALMLGRLRMTIQECINEYERLGVVVFKDRKVGSEELFKAASLEHAMKDVIRQKLGVGMEDAPLHDPLGDACCKTVVFALPAAHPNSIQAQPFRTYTSAYQMAIPCTIWQAARAASAAPTFFKPMRLGAPAKDWIDAGIKFNNPGYLIKAEVGRIWGDEEERLDFVQHIGCFLSLGAGLPEIARLWDKNKIDSTLTRVGLPLRMIKVMKSLMTDTERVAFELADIFPDTIFFRFNVEQGLQAVQLFDYEKIEDISADTENYLVKMKTSVSRCARQMARLSVKAPLLVPAEGNQRLIEASDTEQLMIIQRQLEGLGIEQNTFDRYCKKEEHSNKHSSQLKGLTYLWYACIMADIVEKEGREILERFNETYPTEKGVRPVTEEDQKNLVLSQVLLQNEGNARLYLSFQLYIELKEAVAMFFDEDSVEWLWVANRLAGVAALLGLRDEARSLYELVVSGRMKHLGLESKTTITSIKYAQDLGVSHLRIVS
ncbi:acyl transferase/acyl hydrolase/lysophospholipase [Bisporella sp. PMI_857]|nr:acyl transferase/acyl hydrolase/lysophospholipase [Bisporella sp. PMI_857]